MSFKTAHDLFNQINNGEITDDGDSANEYRWDFINQYIKIPVDISNKVDRTYPTEKQAVRHCIKLLATNLRLKGTVAFSGSDRHYTKHHTKYYTKTNLLKSLAIVRRDGYAFISKKGSKNLKFQKGISSRVSTLYKLHIDFNIPEDETDLNALPLLVVDKRPIHDVYDLAIRKPKPISLQSTYPSHSLHSLSTPRYTTPYGGLFRQSEVLNREYFNKIKLNFGRLNLARKYLTFVNLTRIFKNGECGRWFQKGGYSYQQLSSNERSRMLLNGDKVVEYDYSAMHPHLLYRWQGLQCPGNFYEMIANQLKVVYNDDTKFLVKKVALMSVNAKSIGSLSAAINKDKQDELKANANRRKEGRAEKPILYSELKRLKIDYKDIVEAFRQAHPQIAHYIYSDSANKLMLAESEIMTSVLFRLKTLGIPAIPVHDSVIVPKQHGATARQVMLDSYRCHTGFEIIVK